MSYYRDKIRITMKFSETFYNPYQRTYYAISLLVKTKKAATRNGLQPFYM